LVPHIADGHDRVLALIGLLGGLGSPAAARGYAGIERRAADALQRLG
jgi:hypothetical protein